jgi:GH24 family phage-related lysozyme (muramidase)
MQNVDFEFIKKREGYKLRGYVPNSKKSKSGVTIASGFDLGARNLSDLEGLPQNIVDLLKPFLGFKGAEAKAMASDLVINDAQGKVINEFAKSEALQNLSQKWEAKTGTKFEELPTNKATVIASVAFQYGDLASETPNFWRQVTTDDWNAAVKNLRNFGDDYDSRRELEADYFEAGLTEEEAESKKNLNLS